jgi:serine/threonine kinase PknH
VSSPTGGSSGFTRSAIFDSCGFAGVARAVRSQQIGSARSAWEYKQAQLFSALKSGLDTDGNEPSARRDLIQLLIRLRDRPDITWKIRTDIEKVLTSVQAEELPLSSHATDAARAPSVNYAAPPSSVWTGPAPSFSPGPAPSSQGSGAPPSIPPGPPTGPQPRPMPLFGSPNASAAHPRKSRKRWIIAGGALAAVAAAVAVVILIILPSPPPPKPPTVTTAQLNSILLTPARINTIMGASHMQAGDVLQKMAEESESVSPANCIGALYTGESVTYAGSGWSGVSDQTLQQESSNPNSDVGHFYVDQTAVNFSSADQAQAFLKTSANNWRSCAGQTVTVTNGNNQSHWSLRDLTQTNTKIVQSRTQDSGDGWGCQHALSVVSNLVVDVVACSLQINDQASQITDEMIANAPH